MEIIGEFGAAQFVLFTQINQVYQIYGCLIEFIVNFNTKHLR
jgi:hypothetical protein